MLIFLCILIAALLVFTHAACTADDPANRAETHDITAPAATEAPTLSPVDDTEAPTEEDVTQDLTDAVTEAPTDVPAESETIPGEDLPDSETADPADEDYDPAVYVAIRTPEDLMAFNKAVNEEEKTFYDMIVVILDDLDMIGYTWTPLVTRYPDGVTFDGKGHTISNLTFATREVPTGTPADSIGSGVAGINRCPLFPRLDIQIRFGRSP